MFVVSTTSKRWVERSKGEVSLFISFSHSAWAGRRWIPRALAAGLYRWCRRTSCVRVRLRCHSCAPAGIERWAIVGAAGLQVDDCGSWYARSGYGWWGQAMMSNPRCRWWFLSYHPSSARGACAMHEDTPPPPRDRTSASAVWGGELHIVSARGAARVGVRIRYHPCPMRAGRECECEYAYGLSSVRCSPSSSSSIPHPFTISLPG